MVLLSFSVRKDELLNGTKIRTTRLCTPEKWRLWQATIPPYNRKVLDGWWKPRTKEGIRIFKRPGQDIYRLVFRDLNGRPWPFWECEPMSGQFYAMTWGEAQKWAKEEGFEDDLDGLLEFFKDHYSPLEGRLFQSIAFPPLGEDRK
jgi:hypothetical protein